MQLNPNKEYLRKGIFTLFFKTLEDFEKVNNVPVDACNVQQDMNKELWFMIPTGKAEDEQRDFVARNNSIGFVFRYREIVWQNKKYNYYEVSLPEENILRVVQHYVDTGYKTYAYYDINARMSIEAWA